jgi:hypothetical protein
MKKEFLFTPRIIRSPWSDFRGAEIEESLTTHPDPWLYEIADMGYNGIWLHLVLRDTVASGLFPETASHRKRIEILKRFVEKTSRHGIKVYLYLCEPRSMQANDPFWKKYPHLKGQPFSFQKLNKDKENAWHSLCTSTMEGKEFLEESSYRLFSQVSGLGGAFLITASEYHTHCYSHMPRKAKYPEPMMEEWAKKPFLCPRCAARTPIEVTAEVITLIRNGIKSSSPNADVIAWTWSWYILEKDPQPQLISQLPKDVILMSDFERGGQKKVLGKFWPIDEYSFSSIGPSIRFTQQVSLAKKRGMKVMAKLQLGSTHELVTVPYLPLPSILGKKFEEMKRLHVDGYLGCWIFGGDVSPMTRISALMSRSPQPSMEEALQQVAQEEFGNKSASEVCRAWKKFGTAWKKYPFSIPLLYYGIINYATANPLSVHDTKREAIPSWLPLPRKDDKTLATAGDTLDTWVQPFSADTVATAFEELRIAWMPGVEILKKAVRQESENIRLLQEYILAEHISLSLQSTINYIRFHTLRATWNKEKGDPLPTQLLHILREEIEIAKKDKELLALSKPSPSTKKMENNHFLHAIDNGIGYHSEAHERFFTAADLDAKILQHTQELSHWEKKA